MVVSIIKKRQVASLGEMNRLALKKIFEKENLTYTEETMLEESIGSWSKKVDLEPEERRQLKIIVQALIDNEDGKFQWLKGEMKKHQLDYKKVYDVGL